jgi:hypothetical protein
LHPHFVTTKFIKKKKNQFYRTGQFFEISEKKFIPIALEMDSTLIKLFFELPIFQKNEIHVAKSFGNSNEALWQWLS